MVLAAAGATSTMAHRVRVSVRVRFCGHYGHVAGCKLWTSPAAANSDSIFRLDALALSVIATATWLAGWLSHSGIVSKREQFTSPKGHLSEGSLVRNYPTLPTPKVMCVKVNVNFFCILFGHIRTLRGTVK